MLAQVLFIGVQHRLDDVAQELGDLFAAAAGEGLGGQLSLNFLAGQAEGGVSLDAGNHVVGLALLLDDGGSSHGVLAQALVQLLTIAALLDSLHHDVLAGHEGQLGHDTGADNLRVDDETVRDIQQNVQNCVSSQETLRHRNALVGRVVQRALKPLGTGGHGGVQHIHHQVAA